MAAGYDAFVPYSEEGDANDSRKTTGRKAS
jgi:hypothetical protein